MTLGPLTEALVRSSGRAAHPGDAFEQTLGALVDRARASAASSAWPEAIYFVLYLGARLDQTPLEQLSTLAIEDLALAFLVLRGDPRALATFEQRYLSVLPEQLVRSGISRELADETRLRLAEKLLVGAEPRLATYSGKAPLSAWLRVVALREAVKVQGEQHPAADLEEALELSAAEEDPELKLFKSRFRAEFAQAFREALDALPAQDRLVLRQYFIDELTIDELAALHRVHRATSARWVAHARALLVSKVKRRLQDSLKVEASEVTRLVRAVRSGFDLSLRRFL